MTEPSALIHPHRSFLIIGKPKCGKTGLAATFPQPVCIVDFDNGADTLLHMPSLTEGVEAGRITVIRVARDAVRKQVTAAFNEVAALVKAGAVRTVVVDSLTFMLAALERTALSIEGCDLADDQPDRVDMRPVVGNINRAAEFYINGLLSWPCHLVVTAHEEERDLMRTGKNRRGDPIQIPTGEWAVVPIAFGKMRHTLSSSFDEVWHMVRRPKGGGSEYIVRPSESKREYAGFGSRLDLEGDLPADFTKIMQHYKDKPSSNAALYDALVEPLYPDTKE